MSPVNCFVCNQVSWDEVKCDNCGIDFVKKPSRKVKKNKAAFFRYDVSLLIFPKRSVAHFNDFIKALSVKKKVMSFVPALPLAEKECEQQFFSGGLPSDEFNLIQIAQETEARRLHEKMREVRNERLALEKEKTKLRQAQFAADELAQRSVWHIWRIQQIGGARLRQSEKEKLELKTQLAAVRLRLAEIERYESAFQEAAKDFKAQARNAEAQRAENNIQFEKLKKELEAQNQKQAAKDKERLEKQFNDAKNAFHRLEKERAKLHRNALKLKKWYQAKLAKRLGKLQIDVQEPAPAAASLPMPLAGVLLNIQHAAEAPVEKCQGAVQIAVEPPAKIETEKIPTWQIAAVMCGIALIVGLIAASFLI